uniref:Putative methyltransferase n=1 Tax=viral metagenome TaxID=1070528 RepID=A0A6H2A448_9ZZZZ
MIEKYCNTDEELNRWAESKGGKATFDRIGKFISPLRGDILEIGERNPFTKFLENSFRSPIDNSSGDLNYELITPKDKYHCIICSHVIEHIPNVLTFLNNMVNKLDKHGTICITYPVRLKKTTHHYHEIPIEDMLLLLNEVGLRIVKQEIQRANFGKKIGIRPLLRFWTDKNYLLMCKKHGT